MLNVGSTVLGDWIVEEEIGSGAFGTVYKIKRDDFGEVYYAALKVINIPQNHNEYVNLRTEGMDDESISTYYGQIARDFIKEIKLLSALDGITNIVDYKDHVIIPQEPFGYTIYIKMQLLTPLSKKLVDANNKALFMCQSDIVDLGIGICSALQICEKHNIIHRDIKVDNIFVSANGDYKLGDFGIAKQLEATQGEMSKKGTLLYMAPEVFRGENYDNTVDIYSLGIVLYRLLNKNRAPFFPEYPNPIKFSDKESANAKRLSGETLPPITGVSEELVSILRKACAFNAKDRFQSALEFKNALKDIKKTSEMGVNSSPFVSEPTSSIPSVAELTEDLENTDSAFPSAFITNDAFDNGVQAEFSDDDSEKTGSAFSVEFVSQNIPVMQPEFKKIDDDLEKTESAFNDVAESEAMPVACSALELENDDSEKTGSAFEGNNIVEVALHTKNENSEPLNNSLLDTMNTAITFEESYKESSKVVERLDKTSVMAVESDEVNNVKEDSLTDTINSAINYEDTFTEADVKKTSVLGSIYNIIDYIASFTNGENQKQIKGLFGFVLKLLVFVLSIVTFKFLSTKGKSAQEIKKIKSIKKILITLLCVIIFFAVIAGIPIILCLYF